MTKFNYSEVQGVFTSSQSDRVSCISNFSTVETTIADFMSAGGLSGLGWDSAKQALSPYSVVTKALYNYHCDFGEAYTAFLASFEGEVGETGKTLDTDELRELQHKLNRIQQEKQDLMAKIAGNIALEIIGGYGVMAKDFQIGETQKKIDLLEKYEAFENAHGGDFSGIVSTGGDLEAALSDLGKSKSFNAKTGTYTYADLKNKSWYTNLTSYNDSCPAQRIEIVKTDKYGYGLKVYINGKYSEIASNNLMYAQSKEGMKQLGIELTNMAGEMTGLYSLYRLYTGTDPVTGSKVSRLEAGLWAALLLLPQAKMVEAAKALRAGDRLLAGAALTEADLVILSKAGYFDDVAKIGKIEKTGDLILTELDKRLIETLEKSGVKISREDVIRIRDLPAQKKIVWLEKGNLSAGFEHILAEHGDQFVKQGIPKDKLPDFLMDTLEKGEIVGYQGRGKGRPIYEVFYNGKKHRGAITVGNNGFIVGANPVSIK